MFLLQSHVFPTQLFETNLDLGLCGKLHRMDVLNWSLSSCQVQQVGVRINMSGPIYCWKRMCTKSYKINFVFALRLVAVSTAQFCSSGQVVKTRKKPVKMTVAKWRKSELALTAAVATMALYLGAPRELSETQIMLLVPRNKTPKLTTKVTLKLCLLQPLSQARHVRPGGAGPTRQLWAGRSPRMRVAVGHIEHYNNLVNYVSGSHQL